MKGSDASFAFRDMWSASMRAIREEVERKARSVYWDVWPPAPYGTLGEDIPLPVRPALIPEGWDARPGRMNWKLG